MPEQPVIPIILDGPVGTMLAERGVPTPLPAWSAHAITEAPDVLREIHEAYRDAGATLHTANTFRTTPRCVDDWRERATLAVRIARDVGPTAGSIAPIEDCYRPDLSPASRDPKGSRAHFQTLASVLADAGADLLLCETFPRVDEALLALEASKTTGLPVWVSLTTGYRGDLMTIDEVHAGAALLASNGADAILVNCAPIDTIPTLLDAIRDAGTPYGAYANTGDPGAYVDWIGTSDPADAYGDACLAWVGQGATIVGGCCGTTPEHIRRAATRIRVSGSDPNDHQDIAGNDRGKPHDH